MASPRLPDMLNLIDDAVEQEDFHYAIELILLNWPHLPDPSLLRERTALILASAGRKREALEVYSIAARHYANSGYPTRALAAIKQLLNLNPASTQLLDHFTTLYSVRSPFLERGLRQSELPAPVEKLLLPERSGDLDIDALFTRALTLATNPEGTAERPGQLPPLPMLSLLPPKALRRLLDFLEYEIFAQAQPVIEAGRNQADLFWSVSADLQIYDDGDNLRIPAGALLGLSSFGPHAHASTRTVLSQKGSECLRLSARAVEAMADEFPDFPNRLATLRRHALTEGIFQRHPMFKSLDDLARRELSAGLVGLKLEPRLTCVRQGRTSPGLFIVLDGVVDVVYTGPDFEVTARSLQAGDMFGEVGLIDPRPAPATATTTSPCHLLFLDRETFLSFAQRFDSISRLTREQAQRELALLEDTISSMEELAELE